MITAVLVLIGSVILIILIWYWALEKLQDDTIEMQKHIKELMEGEK